LALLVAASAIVPGTRVHYAACIILIS